MCASRYSQEVVGRVDAITRGPGIGIHEWWDICAADPSATFFATPDWSDILTSAFGHFRSTPLSYVAGDGTKCVVPAIEVRRLGGHLSSLHSMPFGTYGGVVTGSRLGDADNDAIVRDVIGRHPGCFETTISPNPLGNRVAPALANEMSHVHAIDLTKGWAKWWESLDPTARYSLRKARRRGVTVRSGMDVETFEAFYNLHAREARSWSGPNPFGRRFFESLWRYRSPRMELWAASKDGKMLAGVLLFRFQKHVMPFVSCVDPTARPLSPKNLIYARIFRHLCESGWTQFSFLGSDGHRGVERFKVSMGGQRHAFAWINARRPLCRYAVDPIRRVRRSLSIGEPVVPELIGDYYSL